jgi:hypothetical protein
MRNSSSNAVYTFLVNLKLWESYTVALMNQFYSQLWNQKSGQIIQEENLTRLSIKQKMRSTCSKKLDHLKSKCLEKWVTVGLSTSVAHLWISALLLLLKYWAFLNWLLSLTLMRKSCNKRVRSTLNYTVILDLSLLKEESLENQKDQRLRKSMRVKSLMERPKRGNTFIYSWWKTYFSELMS